MKYVSKSLAAALLNAMLLVMGAAVLVENANAAEYAVIVNAENGYSASQDEMKNAVRRIYLKQQTNWPNGIEGAPFSRGEEGAQSAFNNAILNLSDTAYSDYWIKMKQTEGTVAPRAVGSTSILVRQIARNKGGFSVVPASQSLPDGVRVLFKFNE